MIFIFLVHHLICFFKDTLTIPKTKDIISVSSKKYEKIYSVLNKPNNINYKNKYNETLDDGTYIDLLPIISNEVSMKDELKNFLKEQMNSETFLQ
jgi:hypothetical protein